MKKLDYIKENFNIPNVISLMRIIFLIPFVCAAKHDNYTMAGLVLVLSGISDLFDGFIARKLGQVTKIGKMLDPTADKLTLVAVMLYVGIKFPKTFPFMIILIVKEVLMLLAGIVLLKKKLVPPAAKWYGKVSTVVFYISVILIIVLKAVWNFDSDYLNLGLMFVTAFCMLYSLYRYFEIFKIMIKSKNVCFDLFKNRKS